MTDSGGQLFLSICRKELIAPNVKALCIYSSDIAFFYVGNKVYKSLQLCVLFLDGFKNFDTLFYKVARLLRLLDFSSDTKAEAVVIAPIVKVSADHLINCVSEMHTRLVWIFEGSCKTDRKCSAADFGRIYWKKYYSLL